jgi:putative ABC transport system permease protein
MREVFVQVFQNLRANKLRSFLTMFGILWGIISVVVLGATGEGSSAATRGARGAGQERRHPVGRPHVACRRAASAPGA